MREVTRRLQNRGGRNAHPYIIRNKTILRDVNIVDLIDLVGLQCMCNLVQKIGGKGISVPRAITIKRRFMHALIRKEFKELKGGSTEKYKILGKKYGYSFRWVESVVHPCRNLLPELREKCREQVHHKFILDEKLLEIAKQNWEILRKYDLI